MKKEITNIFINSAVSDKFEANSTYYSFRFDTPPIIIKNKANLKVANLSHYHTTEPANQRFIYIFKIDGIMTDNNKYLANDGGLPTLIATNFQSTRNYTEENDIPLIKQTINSIKIIVSNDLNNPYAGVPNTFNFCMSLKIEEEVNE